MKILPETKEDWTKWLNTHNKYGWYHRIPDPIEDRAFTALYYVTEHPAISLDKTVIEENLYSMILDWISTHKIFNTLDMVPCDHYTSVDGPSLLFTLINDNFLKPYMNTENRFSNYFIYKDLYMNIDCWGRDCMYFYITNKTDAPEIAFEEWHKL